MKELKDNKEFYYWLDSYNQCFLYNLIRGIRNTGEIDKEKEICLVSMNANIEKKMIEYSFAQLGQLQLAYALTTHKLQGSAAQTVIGIIDNTHYKLLDNCMLYTMLTRAKKRFALLAEPEAFKRCIVTNHNKRRTWLSLKN